LTSNNKAGLYCTFQNSLIEFLLIDLDGNLSLNLNPKIASKLDHYFSRLVEGLSETGNKGKLFYQHLLNEKMQGSIHQKDSGDCIVCNTDSLINIHKFIPSEV
jgi:hypothetical protein